jgi:hypothetical protein
MIRMRALGLRVRLRHIRPSLGLAVIIRPWTVVDIARRIHPHQTRSAPRSLGHRRSLRSRRRLRCGSSRHRSRCWRRSSNFRSSWCSRSRRSSRSCGSRRIPLLYPLVSSASPLLAGSRRVGPILALAGRTCRRLSHRNLRRQNPRRKSHQTNRCLHNHSIHQLDFFYLARIQSSGYRQILPHHAIPVISNHQ